MDTEKTKKTTLDAAVKRLHTRLPKELVREIGDCAIIAKHESGKDMIKIVGGTGFVGSLVLSILGQNQELFFSVMNFILFGANQGYRHFAKKIARIDAGALCRAIDTETEYRPILVPKTATKEEIIAIIETEYEQRTSKTEKESDKAAEADA